jgi:ABC-type uncharacterized transport system involved in gliding motility auxiliary subunit
VVEAGDRKAELLLPDETAFINTLFRLVTGTRPVVYNLMGHGEHLLDSSDRGGYSGYAELLASQGYDVRRLLLAAEEAVPADADIVVIAAPKLDFTGAELESLDGFIQAGGALLALLDPGTPDSLSLWVEHYNVKLGNNLIASVSSARRQFGVDQRVVVIYDTYGDHPVTRGLTGLPTLFPFTQSLTALRRSQQGLSGEAILMTDAATWAVKNRDHWAAGKLRFNEGVDRPGPLAFGVALEVERNLFRSGQHLSAGPRAAPLAESDDPVLQTWRSLKASDESGLPVSVFTEAATARLIVVGDSDFAVNENLNLYGNRDLLLNMLGWLAREQILIALRPRGSVGEPVVLTVAQKEAIGWGCILGWPLLVGAVSVIFVVRHRRKR